MPGDSVAPAAPSPARSVDTGAPLQRRLLASPHAPTVALALGTLIVCALAAAFATRVTSWAIDETLFKQSALHYSHGLPGSLFHDLNARATSRLYSLLLAPVFANTDGTDGVRVARALSAVMFCSAALPVYLLARRVLASRWAAAAAAFLSIAVPWLILSTGLFTENLAYPLFAWALFAMVRALDRPGLVADALVLVAIALAGTARTQLVFLFPAWLIATWVVAGAARDPRRAIRMAPLTHAVLGVGLLVLLWRLASGNLHGDLQRLLGLYSEVQDRGHVSSDVFLATAVELQSLVFATLTAAVGAIAWYIGALRRGRAAPLWSFAVVAVVVWIVLWVLTAYVQGGYINQATEERYFFYVIPLVWIGALRAIEDPATAGPVLPAVAVVAIALIATVGFSVQIGPETTLLAPVMAATRSATERTIAALHLTGLTARDALALLAGVILVGALWLWRTRPRARLAVFVVVPALLQIGLGAYAYAARNGDVPGVPSATGGQFEKMGWIDGAAPDGTEVTWLNSQLRAPDVPSDGRQYEALFWNSSIRSWAQEPGSNLPVPIATLAALPMRTLTVDDNDGAVAGLDGGPVVQYVGSPFVQLEGRRLALGPFGDLELVQPGSPPRALFVSRGVSSDGTMDAAKPVSLIAFPPAGQRVRLELEFLGTDAGPNRLKVRVDGHRREVALEPGKQRIERFDACPGGGRVTGSITVADPITNPNGQAIGGRLMKVLVQPLPGEPCP